MIDESNIARLYRTKNYPALLKIAGELTWPITPKGIQTAAKIQLWVAQQKKIDAGELTPCKECGGVYEDIATGKNSPHPHKKPLEEMNACELMAWAIAYRNTEDGQRTLDALKEENWKRDTKWINDLLSIVDELSKN